MNRAVKDIRCLLCSLGCPCRVELGEPPWATAAPQDGTGVCARAFALGSLLAHPERINLAACRANGRLKTAPLAEALRTVTQRFARGSPSAVITDGTYPARAVEAALAVAADSPDTLGAVYLPPADEALLRGLEAGGWTRGAAPGPANDAVLIIGDAFATHPPVARRALDIKHAARGNQLLVVSPLVGRTAAFATRAVLVAPGTEAALLLGVARRLGAVVPEVDGAADVPGADVLAAALQKAKAPALVLCAQDGATANAHVAALAAARIAAKLNAPLLPLLTYGNALGARQAATRHGAVPLADAVAQIAAGRIRNLVLLGVDILAALPHLGEQMLRRVEFVAVAAPFANATTARAHVVLPLGLGCEEAGEVMLPSGETVTACPPAPPVAGALTLTELVETMRAQLGGARSDRPAATPAQTSWQLAPPRTGDGLTLIGCGDVLGFDDGSLSSHSDWVQAVRPEPSLLVHPADGKRAGLRTGSTARVKTPAGEARLAVEWTTDVPPGVAAVPLCFPQTRALFRWEIDSAASLVRCGPVEVTLGPAS